LGGLRSTASMISYEIAMGLSLVAVFLYAGTMSTAGIVEFQRAPLLLFGGPDVGLQQWMFIALIPSFVIYVIAMVGETNRAPFDLPEAESELVSGYITEYSGFKYAIYFLAEYINMATVSAIATTLFVGGYLTPWPLNLIPILNNPWLGPIWFALKVQLSISLFVWLRGTLPRFRYDQFMKLGWKWLIPISLGWIVVIAVMRKLMSENLLQGPLLWGLLGLIVVVLLAIVFLGEKPEPEPEPAPDGPFDAYAGGYPVPPMPGQVLPELADVVASTIEPAEAAESADAGEVVESIQKEA
ncbi:MAG: NADH-quinone oxidoreductase subunit H, partial [Propionicimonas sp.]|nr:NADH-quinone oxidoreductase subunit H [Propionicimonas sp.]